MGRRMADTAAHLVVRRRTFDWTGAMARSSIFEFECPKPAVGVAEAGDKKLISEFLALFLRVVQRWYKDKAKQAGFLDGQGGSVSFIQRFGSSLNVTPHFHCAVLDGVYVLDGDSGEPRFIPAPTPTDEEIKKVSETVARRALRLLEKRGVIGDADLQDPLYDDSPTLAGITAASVQSMIATGDRAGLPVRRVLSDPAQGVRTALLCYVSRGFSLHAARTIRADDRAGLESLCSYVTRPPLAAGSLEKVSEDKFVFKLKTPWSDGTTFLILSAHELLEKLAAIVPPKRSNNTRYHGVLAPNSNLRPFVVPASSGEKKDDDRMKTGSTKYRLTWSALLARIFNIQVDTCSCGGKMKIIAFITDPASIRRYLEGEGLPADPPSIAPARPPPQSEFDY